MAHVEPTTEEVDFFLSMLTGLASSADEMGQAKALHRVAENGVRPGSVTGEAVARYSEVEDLAKAGVVTYWEGIRAWMVKHLPPSTPCTNPDHHHE